jgi:hypothetical protein
MATVSEKQAQLMLQRQTLLQENFEQTEKQELTNHLHAQIQDADQMIEVLLEERLPLEHKLRLLLADCSH